MSYILGINAFHANSSACILKDNEIIFAIDEKEFSFSRQKKQIKGIFL